MKRRNIYEHFLPYTLVSEENSEDLRFRNVNSICSCSFCKGEHFFIIGKYWDANVRQANQDFETLVRVLLSEKIKSSRRNSRGKWCRMKGRFAP